MIEIKAKTRGEETVLDIHMSGSDEEIGLELALIVTKVPQELLERNREAFLVMRSKTAEIAEKTARELTELKENEEVHNVKCN
jgi:hypothetical protein